MTRRREQHRPSVPTDLPPALRARLALLLGDELPALEMALKEPPPVSIRLNPAKPGGPGGSPVPWCHTGRYLPERPVFTLDPLLHAGAYYVQEASSMLLEQAVLASGLTQAPILALDLCAAPGGKSTLLRSLLHPDALLVANEVEAKRRHALQENLWKWGLPNVAVTGGPPEDLARLPDMFDLVVVDAPCSGEGLFRKDPYARTQWSEDLVAKCAIVQSRIMEHAWKTLRPGGVLVYSTCTWETAENEDRMRQLAHLGALPLDLPMPSTWGTVPVHVDGLEGHRCHPHRVQGEGFFLCAVRKPGHRPERSIASGGPNGDAVVRAWSERPDRWHLTEHADTLFAVDKCWQGVLRELGTALRMVAPGRPVAESHAGRWRPHAALALDITLRKGSFPDMPMDRATALRYLRGEALPATNAQGMALATYGGLPLGWVNGAGRRWNNLWPGPWRIRMQGT